MDYQELRILYQDWDSPLLTSWVMQIFLSEVVRVPVSLESSSPNINANFYDLHNNFQYSKYAYDWDALRTAAYEVENGDCTKLLSKPEGNHSNYKSCAHVMPEVWSGQRPMYLRAHEEGWTEAAESTGGVAKYSWYVPKFVAQQDPTLLSHFGLAGEQNRHKLANTFLRPTSWSEYCTLISPTNCSDSGNRTIAIGPPPNDEEGARHYVDGQYWGYFRKTPEGDCDLYPDNCTGHIANVPCSWSTFVIPQAHYNDIAVVSNRPLKNGGCPYLRMQEIWHAANHSKSPVLFYWFTPDPLIQELVGTSAEVQDILLPPPTQKCVETRTSPEQRCSSSLTDQLGLPTGGCDSEAHGLHKLIVSNLREQLASSKKTNAEVNPAYEAAKEFRISDLEMASIFDRWYQRDIDKWGYDPRDAVCSWVAENLQELQRFVPRTFPRELRDVETHKSILHRIALVIGCVCCSVTIATGVAVLKYKSKPVLRYAQVDFLFLLLAGCFLVCVGAILLSLEPTTATCVSTTWFILLGYTLELIPLIVKTAAIQTLFNSSRKLKRVKLARKDLFGTVAVVILLVVIYLICITIVDPPSRQKQLRLTDERSSDSGWYQLDVSYYCASTNIVWTYIEVGWQLLLLLLAVILAIQTRGVVKQFNESRRLGLMAYTRFFFVVLRIIILSLYDTVSNSRLQAFQSLANSGETLVATILVYFVPMFHAIFIKDDDHDGRRGRMKKQQSRFNGMLLRTRSMKRSFRNTLNVTAGAIATYDEKKTIKEDESGGLTSIGGKELGEDEFDEVDRAILVEQNRGVRPRRNSSIMANAGSTRSPSLDLSLDVDVLWPVVEEDVVVEADNGSAQKSTETS